MAMMFGGGQTSSKEASDLAFTDPLTGLESNFLGYSTSDLVSYSKEELLAAFDKVKSLKSRLQVLNPTASIEEMKRYITGGEQKFAHEEMTRRIGQDFPDLTFRSTYEETTHGGLLQLSLDQGLPFVMGGGQ